MDYLLLVNVVQPLQDLLRDLARLFLLHSFALLYPVVQLPTLAKLHQQIHILRIRKIPVQWCNVPVPQIRLNAQLSHNLVYVVLLSYHFLRHYLHSA